MPLMALVLASRDKALRFDVGNVAAAAFFLAPIACFGIVRWAHGRHWRRLAFAYGPLLLSFIALMAMSITKTSAVPTPVLAIFAINLAACAAGTWQRHRAQNP